jgi:hypothetical protein
MKAAIITSMYVRSSELSFTDVCRLIELAPSNRTIVAFADKAQCK